MKHKVFLQAQVLAGQSVEDAIQSVIDKSIELNTPLLFDHNQILMVVFPESILTGIMKDYLNAKDELEKTTGRSIHHSPTEKMLKKYSPISAVHLLGKPLKDKDRTHE